MDYKRDNKVPVLTFGELGLVHCLGTAGIPVYTASEGKKNIASYSRYSKKHITFSSYESEDFIDELTEFGETFDEKIILMCHDDRAMYSISNNRKRLKENFLFRLPNAEMVENILDKLAFCRICEKNNLPAPSSLTVSNVDEISAVKSKLKSPYLIKPPYRHYWYGADFKEKVGCYQKAFICQDIDELKSVYKKIAEINPSVVIQEYIMGDDHQLFDVNLHVTEDGKLDAYVIGQKMRVYPPKAGWGSYVRTVFDEEMISICSTIISELDLTGMLNIQFKKDERTGNLKLIEIHTRTSIFDYLGASAGQNIPYRYYKSLTGGKLDETQSYKSGIKYINFARDLRLLIRHRNEYDISLMEWLNTYRDVSVYDGMTLKDPNVLYRELRSALTR